MSVTKGQEGGNKPDATMSQAFSQAGISPETVRGGNAGQASAAPNQSNQQAPRGARQSGRPSIMEVNSLLRRPVSRKQTGEMVQAYERAIRKQIEDSMGGNYKDNFQLHVLDNNTNMLAMSVILLCFAVQDKGSTYLGVYSLVVEGSSGRLNPRFINIGNMNVEIETTAGDIVDRTLWDKITTFLNETYGQKLSLLNAGAMVLPVELSADDESHIHRVVYMATQALYTVMEEEFLEAEKPLSVSMVDNGASLSAILDYNPGDTDTATGLPVRSNVSVVLRGSMAGGQATQTPHEQVRELTRTDAYIDLVWAEPPQQQWGQPPVTQRYFPRVVITRLDSEVDAITPELQLLALSTSTLLSKNNAWGGVFLPRYDVGSGPDLRDIGAIGYEVNLTPDANAKPERIDTKSEQFGKPQLFQLLSMAVHDALIYSMDVEEVGELSWLHQVFIAAANGNTDAYNSIVQSANNLTEGHFARMWQGGPITVDDMNRVHLGYYTDLRGQRRDIRDIDYLALLNLIGEKDMPTVINWSRTFDDVQTPLEIRLEQRAKILKGLLNDLHIKGYARRVTFTPEFITTLNNAAVAAGLVIRPGNLYSDFSGQVGRGTYNAQAFAVGGAAGQGLFNYTQPGYGNYRGVGNTFFGRFG